MKQLTVRGLDPELVRRLKRTAHRQGLSFNKAALLLLRRGAGLSRDVKRPTDVIGSSLDHLIGTWSEKEEKDFLEAIKAFERVDEDLWR